MKKPSGKKLLSPTNSRPMMLLPQEGPQGPQPQCVRYIAVAVGAGSTALGAAAFVGGFVEGILGLAAMLETLGAGGLVATKGTIDMGLGGMAMVDGVNLMISGFNGVQTPPSTASSVGASIAGRPGAAAGEMVNGVGAVRDLAQAANRRTPTGIFMIFATETLGRFASCED